MDVLARGALVVLAAIGMVFFLSWGAPFFIPLFVALMIAYALAPITDLVERVVKWRVVAATLVVSATVALMGAGIWTWSDDVALLWQRLPDITRSVADSLKKVAQRPVSPVAEVKKAAAEIESIAQTGKLPSRSTPQPITASAASFWHLVWEGGKGAATVIAQVMAVLFLVFFMLSSGDLFKRKLVRIFGDTLTEKKITVQVIDEIDQQIKRYLVVMMVANLLVGFGTWVAFRIMGVEYAELWGAAAGILHTAPYFGPAIVAIASLVAGFVQFHDWPKAFMVAGVSIGVATLVGSIFATWLSARQTRMNTTATFVGLLFFGWIWGLWGILLAIPLLAIVKSVSERYEAWHGVAELLGRGEPPAKRVPDEAEKISVATPRDSVANP
ncbi:MAG: AI-2E family transporter [Usitatibacter sp.]